MSNGRAKSPEITTVSIVWSPAGVIAAYWNPAIAGAHAATMLGVQVVTLEVQAQIPGFVREDLYAQHDYDENECTPVDSVPVDPPDTIVVDVSDFE